MAQQRRTPGNVRIEDRWKTKEGKPTVRHGKGNRWMVRWVEPTGDEKSRSFSRKADATNYAGHVTTQLTRGEYTSPELRQTTIGVLFEQWEAIKETEVTGQSMMGRRSVWRNHIKPTWEKVEVGVVRKAHVTSWIAEKRKEGVGASTLQLALVVLRGILEHAVDLGYITANPAQRVKVASEDKPPRKILTVAQVEMLANKVDYLPELVRFLAYTGMRWGEATALTVDDVDLEKRRIRIIKRVQSAGGKLTIAPATKTGENRVVVYPDELDTSIRTVLDGHVWENRLFSSVEGHLLRNGQYMKKFFKPALEACQDEVEGFPDVTIHDLRHTAASLAISAGANPKAVQRLLGHKSATVTMDTYSDLFPDDLDDVGLRMGELIRSGLSADQDEDGNE
ncbi:site-specific integrase [Corynebacterium sp. H128]|uniref:tyrosine-type recombinase/integrase n=1 Tax=Corynebacterium sp. H128 TaxID=3133427 RepID=UPI0030971451